MCSELDGRRFAFCCCAHDRSAHPQGPRCSSVRGVGSASSRACDVSAHRDAAQGRTRLCTAALQFFLAPFPDGVPSLRRITQVVATHYGDMVPKPKRKKAKKEKVGSGTSICGEQAYSADAQWFVKLHWDGWSPRWDQWQPECEVFVADKEGERQMKRVNSAVARKTQGKASSAPAALAGASGTGAAVGGKRAAEAAPEGAEGAAEDAAEGDEGAAAAASHHSLKVELSQQLKKRLLEDYRRCKVNAQAPPLPRPAVQTVRAVLRAFAESKGKQRQRAAKDGLPDSVAELQAGLLDYFDASLPQILLYDTERRAHAKAMEAAGEGAAPCDLYGAEHLLRLLTRLPDLLVHCRLSAEDAEGLGEQLSELIKFLNTKAAQGFFYAASVPAEAPAPAMPKAEAPALAAC